MRSCPKLLRNNVDVVSLSIHLPTDPTAPRLPLRLSQLTELDIFRRPIADASALFYNLLHLHDRLKFSIANPYTMETDNLIDYTDSSALKKPAVPSGLKRAAAEPFDLLLHRRVLYKRALTCPRQKIGTDWFFEYQTPWFGAGVEDSCMEGDVVTRLFLPTEVWSGGARKRTGTNTGVAGAGRPGTSGRSIIGEQKASGGGDDEQQGEGIVSVIDRTAAAYAESLVGAMLADGKVGVGDGGVVAPCGDFQAMDWRRRLEADSGDGLEETDVRVEENFNFPILNPTPTTGKRGRFLDALRKEYASQSEKGNIVERTARGARGERRLYYGEGFSQEAVGMLDQSQIARPGRRRYRTRKGEVGPRSGLK